MIFLRMDFSLDNKCMDTRLSIVWSRDLCRACAIIEENDIIGR